MQYKVKWAEQLGEVVQAIEEGKVSFTFSKAKKLEQLLNSEQRAKKSKDNDDLKVVRNEIKYLISEGGEELLKFAGIPLNRAFTCIFHPDTNPSLVYYKDSKRWYCFGCGDGKHKDIIDVLSEILGISNQRFNIKRDRVIKLLGVGMVAPYASQQYGTSEPMSYISQQHETSKSVQVSGYGKYKYYKAVQEDAEAMAFLRARGIADASIDKFDIRVWSYGNAKYICILAGKQFWVRRRLYSTSQREKYWNKKDVPVELFNTKVLSGDATVFVVEATFDAILLDAMGYEAVALNSISNTNTLLTYLKDNPENKNSFIILLDNDAQGKKSAFELECKLFKANKRAISHVYVDHYLDERAFLTGYKDVGEAYVANKEKTKQALDIIYSENRPILEALQNSIPAQVSSSNLEGVTLQSIAEMFGGKLVERP